MVKKEFDALDFPTMFGPVTGWRERWEEDCPECGHPKMKVTDCGLSSSEKIQRVESCPKCGYKKRAKRKTS